MKIIYLFQIEQKKISINLIDTIYGHIYQENRIHILRIPFDEGQIFSSLKENNTILETKYEADGTYVKTILTPEQEKQYKKISIE